MDTSSQFDPDLIRRYDEFGPRYTSYPTAPQFHDAFGEAELNRQALKSNGELIPRDLSTCERYLERRLREVGRVAVGENESADSGAVRVLDLEIVVMTTNCGADLLHDPRRHSAYPTGRHPHLHDV